MSTEHLCYADLLGLESTGHSVWPLGDDSGSSWPSCGRCERTPAAQDLCMVLLVSSEDDKEDHGTCRPESKQDSLNYPDMTGLTEVCAAGMRC